LPLSEYQPRVAPPPRPKDLPLAGQRVWLVEDDGLVREALTERLQHWGATVHSWGDAESLLRDWPANLPHVLVTDYRLPGLDGLGLLQAVAKRVGDTAAQIKTLLVSGDTDPQVLAQLNASGYPVLSKPFRPERMLERLDIGLI
jgi:two-component system nitrogen regulation response regulator GlnG